MSDIRELLKSIGTELRNAQNFMFSKKLDEASEKAGKIDALIEEAQGIDPANIQLTTFRNQAAKLRKDLAARTGQSSPAPSVQNASAPQKEAGNAPALPAGVEKRIRDVQNYIARGKIEDARGIFDEIVKMYAQQFDTSNPVFTDTQKLLSQKEEELATKKAASAEAKKEQDTKREQAESLAQQWIHRFKEIQSFGFYTEDISNLKEQEVLYHQAVTLMETYRGVDFSCGKMDQLSQMESKIISQISEFPSIKDAIKKKLYDDAIALIDSRIKALQLMIEGLPAIMSESSIAEVQASIGKTRSLFDEGSPERNEIERCMESMLSTNQANRLERAKLIRMKPEKYSGAESEVIKKRAVDLVLQSQPEAHIVRCVVTSEDWKELSQWEDYAGNQRFVTRREIYAQVSSTKTGLPQLHTIYITKEKHSDGSWSALTGNIMYSEMTVAENL